MNTASKPRTRAVAAFALLLTFSLLVFGSLAYGFVSDTLTVDYIDVGQGDSILLHASDGTDILIDGGPRSAGPTVVAHLQNAGVDDIEVMVLTHGDADHVGGLIEVLRSTIPVESVIYNGQDHTSQTYQDFVAEMQQRGLTPTPGQAGQVYAWGQINASVLNPQTVLDPDQNPNSVTLLVIYGDLRFLFTGDITNDAEQVLLNTGTLSMTLPADILKVAHHGSRYSSSQAFLDAVAPEVAVISVGASNPYGHPTQETLDRLKAAGAQVLRTDQNGTITVITDGQTFEVRANYVVFLPMVVRDYPPTPTPSPTPTATPTPTNTPEPAATETPSPTATQGPVTSGNVVITSIFYDGAGRQEPNEYVEIRNADSRPIQLQNWTLRDVANHVYTFPSFVMSPGQTCRVYTNENHPEWCGFNYGSGSAIWNNSGDTAYLRDSNGALIDSYSY